MMHEPLGRSYSFRCRSMTEEGWHIILVPAKGNIICSCQGENWCSHIDATLVAGERAMVPAIEHAEANRAQIAARGRLRPPQDWKGHWRSNRRWRGLPPVRSTALAKCRSSGSPMMSLEGRGAGRQEILDLSHSSGWMVTPHPTRGCLFHIVPHGTTTSRAACKARKDGIPILSYEEWRVLAGDLAAVMTREIAQRISSCNRFAET